MTNQKQNETIPALPRTAKTYLPTPKVKDEHTHTHNPIIYFFLHYCTKGGRVVGPADGEGWDIERDSMVTWWLSFTYDSMNTRDRRSQTGKWSELRAVPIYTENNKFMFTFFSK